jgi:hypothetical protein
VKWSLRTQMLVTALLAVAIFALSYVEGFHLSFDVRERGLSTINVDFGDEIAVNYWIYDGVVNRSGGKMLRAYHFRRNGMLLHLTDQSGPIYFPVKP